jgi:transcriptional regulator with XRE-family HTH domain
LHSPQYKAYIAVLVEARIGARMTQQALAKTLEKPQSFVSKYERGERRLDVPEFLLIARALGVRSVTLIRRIEAKIFDE